MRFLTRECDSSNCSRAMRATLHWGLPLVAILLVLCSVSPADAAEPVIPNLRATRDHLRPWTVDSETLSASVAATRLEANFGYAVWRLDVEIKRLKDVPWALMSVTTDAPDAKVDVAKDRQPRSGPRIFSIEFMLPMWCPLTKQRERVTGRVTFMDVQGEHTEDLALDYRCLLGDFVPPLQDATLAELARTYSRDPVIERLVRQTADIPLGPPAAEIERLKQLVHFDGATSIRADPREGIPEMRHGTAYNLAPTETYRYGGDCEDWAILSAAYFYRRGLDPTIATTYGHVWVLLQQSARGALPVLADFVGNGPGTDPPDSVALFALTTKKY